MKRSGEQEPALSRQLLFAKPQSLRQATDIADNLHDTYTLCTLMRVSQHVRVFTNSD